MGCPWPRVEQEQLNIPKGGPGGSLSDDVQCCSILKAAMNKTERRVMLRYLELGLRSELVVPLDGPPRTGQDNSAGKILGQ